MLERNLDIRDTATDAVPNMGSNASLSPRKKQIIFRTLLVLMTALVAASVSHLGLIVSFFGSVNGSLIALILPPFLVRQPAAFDPLPWSLSRASLGPKPCRVTSHA